MRRKDAKAGSAGRTARNDVAASKTGKPGSARREDLTAATTADEVGHATVDEGGPDQETQDEEDSGTGGGEAEASNKEDKDEADEDEADEDEADEDEADDSNGKSDSADGDGGDGAADIPKEASEAVETQKPRRCGACNVEVAAGAARRCANEDRECSNVLCCACGLPFGAEYRTCVRCWSRREPHLRLAMQEEIFDHNGDEAAFEVCAHACM